MRSSGILSGLNSSGNLSERLSELKSSERERDRESTPQAQFNFLCAREETMAWMPGCGVSGLLGGFELESRSLPVSVLGIGKGKVADKSFKLFRSILLETGAGLGF